MRVIYHGFANVPQRGATVGMRVASSSIAPENNPRVRSSGSGSGQTRVCKCILVRRDTTYLSLSKGVLHIITRARICVRVPATVRAAADNHNDDNDNDNHTNDSNNTNYYYYYYY